MSFQAAPKMRKQERQEEVAAVAAQQREAPEAGPVSWEDQRSLLQRFTSIWMSNEDGEDEQKGRGRKVPSGFDKILKRTRRGISHQSKDAKEDESKSEEASEEKKAKEEERKEEEESDGEQEEKKKKKKKDKDEEQSWGQKVYGFFMEPDGGGPNWENWLKVAVMGGLVGYYGFMAKSPSEEITYNSFVTDYLQPNNVEMITLSEEKNNASYKYRAIVETRDGKRVHLVLPQVENFLMKLDMSQR